jgi:hypothetical protein
LCITNQLFLPQLATLKIAPAWCVNVRFRAIALSKIDYAQRRQFARSRQSDRSIFLLRYSIIHLVRYGRIGERIR